MAIQASAVWRARPGGNAANGAGFDAAISGAGTDYSQQDAAQASAAAGTAAGTAAFSDAAALFTAAMVGNAMRIASGAGFTVGYYFIVGYTSATAVTLDRSPGTGSAANWKVGGAYGGAASCPFFLADSARATGNKVVAGNKVGIWGASGVVASPDFSWTGLAANPPVAGDTTSGAIEWFGEGPNRPILYRSDGESIFVNGGGYHRFKNLYIKIGASSGGRMFDGASSWFMEKVTIDLNDQNCGVIWATPITMLNCEIFSKTSGTPTSRTLALLDVSSGFPVWMLTGCYFHDIGSPVLNCGSGAIVDCLFNKGVKTYVANNSSDDRGTLLLQNNTFNNCADDAVSLTTAAAVATTTGLNNIFSNNVGSGKVALKLTGTAALNDRLKMWLDYNDYYNNTANVSNVTLGASDLTLDPQYTSSTDFTLNGTNLQAQAYPRATITGG